MSNQSAAFLAGVGIAFFVGWLYGQNSPTMHVYAVAPFCITILLSSYYIEVKDD